MKREAIAYDQGEKSQIALIPMGSSRVCPSAYLRDDDGFLKESQHLSAAVPLRYACMRLAGAHSNRFDYPIFSVLCILSRVPHLRLSAAIRRRVSNTCYLFERSF